MEMFTFVVRFWTFTFGSPELCFSIDMMEYASWTTIHDGGAGRFRMANACCFTQQLPLNGAAPGRKNSYPPKHQKAFCPSLSVCFTFDAGRRHSLRDSVIMHEPS
jgi:hypothetical protein